MMKRVGTIALAMAVVAMVGCMPKMTIEEMKAMAPQRPAELDKLEMLIGTWEGTGEATMCVLDEPLKTTSKGTAEWGCDGWCVIERGVFEMGELGSMEGIGIWAYDVKSKKYLSFWMDSMGMTGVGTATYCDKTKTWKMKSKGRSPWGKSFMRGTMSFPDPDTAEWTMTEWDGSQLFKTMELKGTSHRK